jgi:hypothetical protein
MLRYTIYEKKTKIVINEIRCRINVPLGPTGTPTSFIMNGITYPCVASLRMELPDTPNVVGNIVKQGTFPNAPQMRFQMPDVWNMQDCTLCLEDLNLKNVEDDPAIALTCSNKHAYCLKCVENLYAQPDPDKRICPLCRVHLIAIE